MWPCEARRTGPRFVARRPCVDPIECRDERREDRDDYRHSEKYD